MLSGDALSGLLTAGPVSGEGPGKGRQASGLGLKGEGRSDVEEQRQALLGRQAGDGQDAGTLLGPDILRRSGARGSRLGGRMRDRSGDDGQLDARGTETPRPLGQVGTDGQDEIGARGDEPFEPLPYQGGQAASDGEVVEGDDQPGATAPASAQGEGGQGAGAQAVSVDGVGPTPQATQPGHDARVAETRTGPDLERLGAGRGDVQPVQDSGGGLDDDVMPVSGQYPSAVGQVRANPSGGRSADLEDPQAPSGLLRGVGVIRSGAGAHAFSFFLSAMPSMVVGVARAPRTVRRRLRSARWIAARTTPAAATAPATAVRTARLREAT